MNMKGAPRNNRNLSDGSSAKALPTKPMGRPLLIGEEADQVFAGFRICCGYMLPERVTCPLTKDWAR